MSIVYNVVCPFLAPVEIRCQVQTDGIFESNKYTTMTVKALIHCHKSSYIYYITLQL